MIRLCDAIMGSGKSSAAITYMNEHPEKKFIYITPYLEEATRIKKACPKLRFREPKKGLPEYGYTKTGHTIQLMKEGRNIASTHQAFLFYTQEVLDLVREKHYTLIIDEDVSVLDSCDINEGDLELLVRAGYIEAQGDRYVVIDNSYSGEAFAELFRLLQSRELVVFRSVEGMHFCYWKLPKDLIESFDDVYILTYLAEGQGIRFFMDMSKISYKKIGVERDRNGIYRFSDDTCYIPDYVGSLSQYIHICDHKKLNAIGEDWFALSKSWFAKPDNEDRLRKHIGNYFKNLNSHLPASKRMWGTYCDNRNGLRGKGYTNAFVVFNERATNQYRDREILVYAANPFMNVGQKLFYQKNGVAIDEDMYALSTMIQWIWRSAIRDGKPIEIYIPSSRMRSLLIQWMKDAEEQYRQYASAKELKEAC